jgi:restriction endonuclease Mrr
MEENKDFTPEVPAEEPKAKEAPPPAPKVEPAKKEETPPPAAGSEPPKQETVPPDLSEELKAANERAEAAEQKAEVLGMGVKPEAVADVIALAKTRQSDKQPFKKAVEEVLETYGNFKAAPTITTGTKTTGDTQDDYSKERAVMGLKPENN